MQFLNDDFIIKGKKLSKPTWPYVKNELPLPVKSWKNCD